MLHTLLSQPRTLADLADAKTQLGCQWECSIHAYLLSVFQLAALWQRVVRCGGASVECWHDIGHQPLRGVAGVAWRDAQSRSSNAHFVDPERGYCL